MFSLTIPLDRDSPVPLYLHLAQQLQGAIEAGTLPPGVQLGNEIVLAQRFGLSRPTIRSAIQELVAKGLLVRKRGVGTQVVHGPVTTRPLKLTSLFEDRAEGHHSPGTTVLVNEVLPAGDDVAAAPQIPRRRSVLHLRRLRTADGQPLAILKNYLPTDLIDIGRADLTELGLYQAMRAAGTHPRVARQLIGARDATPEECRLLDDPPQNPLLTMDRVSHDDTGRPIEWARHAYRPTRHSFTIALNAR